jgi:hypothetical protein
LPGLAGRAALATSSSLRMREAQMAAVEGLLATGDYALVVGQTLPSGGEVAVVVGQTLPSGDEVAAAIFQGRSGASVAMAVAHEGIGGVMVQAAQLNTVLASSLKGLVPAIRQPRLIFRRRRSCCVADSQVLQGNALQQLGCKMEHPPRLCCWQQYQVLGGSMPRHMHRLKGCALGPAQCTCLCRTVLLPCSPYIAVQPSRWCLLT